MRVHRAPLFDMNETTFTLSSNRRTTFDKAPFMPNNARSGVAHVTVFTALISGLEHSVSLRPPSSAKMNRNHSVDVKVCFLQIIAQRIFKRANNRAVIFYARN
jgi:hypothetical protein